MKNIIFIEGVSGVGKSTTVNKLGDALRNLGYTVKCHNEGDPDNPLHLCWAAYLEIREYEHLLLKYPLFVKELSENIIYRGEYILLRYQVRKTPLYVKEHIDELHKREFCISDNAVVPLSKFTEVFANLWRRYADSDDTDIDYAVFDASLVSHMTNDLLRNYNASENELIEHLDILLRIINHLNPAVFYLSSENVRERLEKARHTRGQPPLDEEKVKFWEKRKQMDLSVLPKLSVKSKIIDIINDNWDSVVSDIISQIHA